jgi:hypothetical protein
LPGNFNRFQVWSEASDGSAAIDGARAFVEWWATFGGGAPRREEPTGTLRGWFGKWLESLRSTLVSRPPGFPKATTGEVGDRSQVVSG